MKVRKKQDDYSQLGKQELINLLTAADSKIKTLMFEKQSLFVRSMQQQQEVVLYRRQIELLVDENKKLREMCNGKRKKERNTRI